VTCSVGAPAAGQQPADLFASEPRQLLDSGAGEGPAWHPQLGLLFSGGGHIQRYSLDGSSSIYRRDAGSNGLVFDRSGRLLVCESVGRRIARLDADGKRTVLAERYDGHRFNQPNDITLDSHGRIYFTDPRYGSRDGIEMVDDQGRQVEGVYRIDPDGRITRIIAHEVDRPNGIAISADDRFLYVADNNNNQQGAARKLWRFDLRADGSIDPESRKLLMDFKQGRGPDGMALDQQGRLYVAGGRNHARLPFETADEFPGGIYVLSPQGERLATVPIPHDEVTNCAFGGDDLRTLYITAGGTLWSIRTTTAGRPVWPPGN
jgi:gluconolactonase